MLGRDPLDEHLGGLDLQDDAVTNSCSRVKWAFEAQRMP
jgi:hypothetical protein